MRGSPTHSLTSRSLVTVWVAVGTNSLFPEVLLCAGLPCLLLIWKPSVFLSLASLYFCLFLCVTQVYLAVEADEYWSFFYFSKFKFKIRNMHWDQRDYLKTWAHRANWTCFTLFSPFPAWLLFKVLFPGILGFCLSFSSFSCRVASEVKGFTFFLVLLCLGNVQNKFQSSTFSVNATDSSCWGE